MCADLYSLNVLHSCFYMKSFSRNLKSQNVTGSQTASLTVLRVSNLLFTFLTGKADAASRHAIL